MGDLHDWVFREGRARAMRQRHRPADVPDARLTMLRDWHNDEDEELESHLTLQRANLWFATASFLSLVEAAHSDLPSSTRLEDALTNLERGEDNVFCLFARPLCFTDDQGVLPVNALLWGRTKDSPLRLGIQLLTNIDLREGLRWIPGATVEWSVGESIMDVPPHAGKGALSWEAKRRVVAAIWALRATPNLVDETVERPPRQVGRREVRLGREPSTVQVVDLRQTVKRTAGAEGADEARDRDHRWLVAGHWKLQPYGPGSSLRRPTYIAPYLAGPPDKPLVVRPKVGRLR